MKRKYNEKKVSIKKIYENYKKKYNKDKKNFFKLFFIFFCIYIISLISLIRADINYDDDLGRVVVGYREFGFGRYVSDFLSIFIHNSKYLSDVSPFTTIISVSIMSISSIMIIKILTEKELKEFKWYDIAAALPIGMNPYFLQCYSFKFDSPYMALSVLFSIIPFLFYKKDKNNKNKEYIIISIIFTFLMCASYQASSGIYPMIVISMALIMFNNMEDKNEILKFIIKSCISYGVGLILFKLTLIGGKTYYLDSGLLSIKDIIPKSFVHYKTYYSYVLNDFKLNWLICIFILILSFVVTIITNSKQKKLIAFTSSIVSLILYGLVMFGAYPYIKNPIFGPRALYGFCIFIGIIAIISVNGEKSFVSKLMIIFISYSFFITSLIYGNLANIQEKYSDFRTEVLLNDLNEFQPNNEILKIDLSGTIGQPLAVQRVTKEIPILNRLLPVSLGDNSVRFNVYKIATFYNVPNIEFNIDKKNDVSRKEMKLVKRTRYHDIYQKDKYILIILK